MIASTKLLKTPKILSLARSNEPPRVPAALYWRQNFLLITAVHNIASKAVLRAIPALHNQQWFEACLQNSPVSAVRLDIGLGEAMLKGVANACDRTGKRVFVHLPAATYRPQSRAPWAWRFKRLADWIVAAGLFVGLSPVLLLIALLIKINSPGPVLFRQWRVGDRGQLFQIIKFRTMRSDAEQFHHQLMSNQAGIHKLRNDPRATGVGRWLRKYSLDELPQLLNVLRGEMSLVGPRPWTLYDAVRVAPEFRRRMNALPGITGAWQVMARSYDADLASVSRMDLAYLHQWTVQGDLRFLLLTVPKVGSGFGAY